MSVNANTPTNWSDPSTCPFCGAALESPGAGFVDHLDESPACDKGFGNWKEHVAGDLGGEWSG